MSLQQNLKVPAFLLIGILLLFSNCSSYQKLNSNSVSNMDNEIGLLKLTGGSSGMEQMNDSTYIVVYDLKSHSKAIRLGKLTILSDTIIVSPIEVDAWDKEGISNDLESICAIPDRSDEYLIAEAGNWQGKYGRIFHIKLNTSGTKATVLTSFKYPQLHKNDFGLTGDQYEAIHCLPLNQKEKIIILVERGGSKHYPSGIFRWGRWNLDNNSLTISGNGLHGLEVSAPGNWTYDNEKRSITDLHVDEEGIIWASASEDQSESGPFYSVIYEVGKVNPKDPDKPVILLNKYSIAKEIHGFKIEALSGPAKGIDCTHSFGTEDEIYGGIWRPVKITP